MMRHFVQSLLIFACAALLQSCQENTTTEPAPPAPTIISAGFVFDYPVEEIRWDLRESLILRWRTLDSSLDGGEIHYRAEGASDWKFLYAFQKFQSQTKVSLEDVSAIRYEFAIRPVNGVFTDTSAIVHIVAPILTEPKPGQFVTSVGEHHFRWTNVPEGCAEVEIRWKRMEDHAWQAGWTLPAGDGAMRWTSLPFGNAARLDFAIRAVDSPVWTTVRGVHFARLEVRSPKVGEEVYRYLTKEIDITLGIPPGFGHDSLNVIELSTDGGKQWERIQRQWFITQPASADAYIRVSNPDVTYHITTGPFSIVDRVQEYFQPRPGMVLHYDRKYSARDHTGTITWQRSITISVLSEIRKAHRTEFPCSIQITDEKGGRSTSSGLLWQDTTIFRVVRGDFEPFLRAEIPGRHDASVGSTYKSFNWVHPSSPVAWTEYYTQRGKGVVYQQTVILDTRETGSFDEWYYRD